MSVSKESEINKPLNAARKNCEEVAQIHPGSTHAMGAKLQEMILHYYEDVRKQAQQSFYCALAAAFVGTSFYIYAVLISAPKGNYNEVAIGGDAKLSLIAGTLIQVISGLNFFLYQKATRQFSTFHICLERTNRFLIANTLCDNISCSIKRDDIRQELINTISNASMLTLDVINEGKAKVPKQTVLQEKHKKSDLNGEQLSLQNNH